MERIERYYLTNVDGLMSDATEETLERLCRGLFSCIPESIGFALYAYDQKALEADIAKTPRRGRGEQSCRVVMSSQTTTGDSSRTTTSVSSIDSVASKSKYASKPFSVTSDEGSVTRFYPVLATSDTSQSSFCDNIPRGHIARLGVLALVFGGSWQCPLQDLLWRDDSVVKKVVTHYLLKLLSSDSISNNPSPQGETSSEENADGEKGEKGEKNSKSDEKDKNIKKEITSHFLNELGQTFTDFMTDEFLHTHHRFCIPKFLNHLSRLARITETVSPRHVKARCVNLLEISEYITSLGSCLSTFSGRGAFIMSFWEDISCIIDVIHSSYKPGTLRVFVSRGSGGSPSGTSRRSPRRSSRSPSSKRRSKRAIINPIPRINLRLVKTSSKTEGLKKLVPSSTTPFIQITFSGESLLTEYLLRVMDASIQNANAAHKNYSRDGNAITLRITNVNPMGCTALSWKNILYKRKSEERQVLRKISRKTTVTIVDQSGSGTSCPTVVSPATIFEILSGWGCQVRMIDLAHLSQLESEVWSNLATRCITVFVGSRHSTNSANPSHPPRETSDTITICHENEIQRLFLKVFEVR